MIEKKKNCLIALLEKWRESIDRGLAFGILLSDLSKAFDCLSHDLFIAKLFSIKHYDLYMII